MSNLLANFALHIFIRKIYDHKTFGSCLIVCLFLSEYQLCMYFWRRLQKWYPKIENFKRFLDKLLEIPTVISWNTWTEKTVSLNQRNIFLIQRNRSVYIKENLLGSTKLSSIQRVFFFDRISKKCFFDSKKLFSGCDLGFIQLQFRKI